MDCADAVACITGAASVSNAAHAQEPTRPDPSGLTSSCRTNSKSITQNALRKTRADQREGCVVLHTRSAGAAHLNPRASSATLEYTLRFNNAGTPLDSELQPAACSRPLQLMVPG
jgi:hypothetical protein